MTVSVGAEAEWLQREGSSKEWIRRHCVGTVAKRRAWAAWTRCTPNVWNHDYRRWRAGMRGFALGVAVLARRMSTSAQDGDSGGAAA
uniref:Uncharacterized protein n=1 Tax=Oryza rufipogon TaxID=4529 RepID=A0A0E0PXT2_ORYRU